VLLLAVSKTEARQELSNIHTRNVNGVGLAVASLHWRREYRRPENVRTRPGHLDGLDILGRHLPFALLNAHSRMLYVEFTQAAIASQNLWIEQPHTHAWTSEMRERDAFSRRFRIANPAANNPSMARLMAAPQRKLLG
jgi:hypothetical protein